MTTLVLSVFALAGCSAPNFRGRATDAGAPVGDRKHDGGSAVEAGAHDAASMDASMADGALGGSAFTALAVGFHHSCAVLRSGHVYCWGGNAFGELGSETSAADCPESTFPCSPDAKRVPGIDDAMDVAAGEGFSCALTRGGGVWCWGSNAHGQIGAGADSGPVAPVRVRFQSDAARPTKPLAGVDALAVGRAHACARLADTQGLVCWGGGANDFGQIPAADPAPFAIATDIKSGVERFALGHYHGCFTDAAGALSCWGWNADGQLGLDSEAIQSSMPHPIFQSNVTAFSLGDAHTCATVDGAVRCLGLAATGQLGIGPVPAFPDCSFGPCTSTPQIVDSTIEGVPAALELGDRLSCARYENGRVACWGSNEQQRAGQAGVASVMSPRYVPSPRGVRLLATFAAHACVATETDEIYCWGSNDQGQLGPVAAFGGSTHELNEVVVIDDLP